MQYSALLKMKEWQRTRLIIMGRDNFKCQAHNCTNPESILNVHHRVYFGKINPWDYPNDLLITLCDKCHKKEHCRERIEADLFTALRVKGFLYGDISAFTTMLYTGSRFLENLKNDLADFQLVS